MTDQPMPKTFHSALPAVETSGSQPRFALWDSEHPLMAFGHERDVPSGPITSLASRVDNFFQDHGDEATIVVGALPFDRAAPDALFQPSTVSRTRKFPTASAFAQVTRATLLAEPSARDYSLSVQKSLDLMLAEPSLRKVVLSRSLVLEARNPLNPYVLAARLAEDASVTTFLTALPDIDGRQRTLVGATPELLVRKSGLDIASHPLAGSARRHVDRRADDAAVAALQTSEKDLREHAAVVEAILDTLSPLCKTLTASQGPSARATATMWHLGTRIEGTLKSSDTTAAELAAALHPTPAVCGLPRQRAQEVIADLEAYDRQFYAGAVGWVDNVGDGAWYVSIRCAELSGNRARLYAGAGIVPGSDPEAEARETSAKFLALLRALDIDENGDVMGSAA